MSLSGRKIEAVELIASILAEPMSEKQTLSEAMAVDEMAREVLERLKSDTPSEEFEVAMRTGSAKPYETAAKVLIDSLD